MKKGFYSVVLATAVLGGATMAFAGAYGEAEQPEEIPAPAPAPPPAPEPEPERVLRLFEGFLTDAETTRGLWVELSAMYGVHYYDNLGDTEAVNTHLHVSYGQEMFEVGLAVPYLWFRQDTFGEEDAFGDLRLWGKVIPLRTEHFSLGGGLITSFPTGDDGAGTAEYGFEPFITMGAVAGPVQIRSHIGYNVFTEHDVLGDVYDRLDVSLNVLAPITDMVVVRGELSYQYLTHSRDDDFEHPLTLYPGVDFYIPVGGDNELIIRPTLGVGLTQEAPDWQGGLGIAFNTGLGA